MILYSLGGFANGYFVIATTVGMALVIGYTLAILLPMK